MSKHLKNVLLKLSKGMTQAAIAKEIGISQAGISLMLKRIKFCPHCAKPLFVQDTCEHEWSRALDQKYPRTCLKCGISEHSK